jgi:hypothetical protein
MLTRSRSGIHLRRFHPAEQCCQFSAGVLLILSDSKGKVNSLEGYGISVPFDSHRPERPSSYRSFVHH